MAAAAAASVYIRPAPRVTDAKPDSTQILIQTSGASETSECDGGDYLHGRVPRVSGLLRGTGGRVYARELPVTYDMLTLSVQP
jgi:hypothetical protein